MENKKTLEQVLKELKDAEKEFNEKCLKYGIVEKREKKPKEETAIIEESKEKTDNVFKDKPLVETSEN